MISILNRGSYTEGTLKLKKDFNCGGEFIGSIHSDHDVVFLEGSRFKGQISAKKVEIHGVAEGNINALHTVEIKKQGSIDGDITCRTFSLDKSSNFSGTLFLK